MLKIELNFAELFLAVISTIKNRNSNSLTQKYLKEIKIYCSNFSLNYFDVKLHKKHDYYTLIIQ